MAIAKRILLFLILNLLVVLSVSLLLTLLHIQPTFHSYGFNLSHLMMFCLMWGMVGALVSLSLSRVMAKWMMGVTVIDPATDHPEEKALVELVHHLAKEARLPMPQVGIYPSSEVNAFATGPTRKRSLVAVSSGLLQRMQEKELRGVLGHEISHIANGDMVTMTLLQGVVNAFVMFLARLLASVVSSAGRSRQSSGSYYLFVLLFEVVFMIFGSLVVAAFSRHREFRADRGGARLAGKRAMIEALQALASLPQRPIDPKEEQHALAALKIAAKKRASLFRLFATHPPLEERIARLQSLG